MRAKSAIQRSKFGNNKNFYEQANERSRSRGSSASPVSKRLGGPGHPNTNFMNNASREQRAILYTREGESALLNRLGPGPAKYSSMANKFDSKFKYSIPKVSDPSSDFKNSSLQEILASKTSDKFLAIDPHPQTSCSTKKRGKSRFLTARQTPS